MNDPRGTDAFPFDCLETSATHCSQFISKQSKAWTSLPEQGAEDAKGQTTNFQIFALKKTSSTQLNCHSVITLILDFMEHLVPR